jgi:hypothetical protein
MKRSAWSMLIKKNSAALLAEFIARLSLSLFLHMCAIMAFSLQNYNTPGEKTFSRRKKI